MAETKRRRERQEQWNAENGITPESVKSNIKDILASPYEKDRVTVPVGVAEDGKPFIGDNFKATLRDLEARMREAAANLEFETAARLRDEVKRLKMLDLEFAADAMSTTGEAEARAEVQSARAEYRARYAERPKRGGKR